MRCGRSSGTSLLVQQVWHTDLSANRQARCFIAAIDQLEVVEKILRHLGLWNGGPDFAPARAPPDPAGPKTSSPTEDQPPARAPFAAVTPGGAPVECVSTLSQRQQMAPSPPSE